MEVVKLTAAHLKQMEEAVTRGAMVLDLQRPRWWELRDHNHESDLSVWLSEFNMQVSTCDIEALTGDASSPIATKDPDDSTHGVYIPDNESVDMSDAAYVYLHQLWLREVLRRVSPVFKEHLDGGP